jgi:hypothetical protein
MVIVRGLGGIRHGRAGSDQRRWTLGEIEGHFHRLVDGPPHLDSVGVVIAADEEQPVDGEALSFAAHRQRLNGGRGPEVSGHDVVG